MFDNGKVQARRVILVKKIPNVKNPGIFTPRRIGHAGI